ncbi:hypothetical protein FDECE_6980 [Fusarium decemcellulare]|nr:hypothetical protein FDECE_6980 [Fusarium decemcellulare]
MPEQVNFYTPENSDFYSRFGYSDLDPASNCIRLLRIKPPTTPDLIKTEQIECDLLNDISLDSIRGKYTTLSYCAASPHDIEIVLVNGIPFNAFANLGHALRQARHFWIESGEQDELLLWADQICINQNNPSERTHQVKFMADIYAASQQVLVSLSTEHDTEGGLGWFQGIVRVLERMIEEGDGVLGWNPKSFHGLGLNAFLKTILMSSWWTRAWIRQEFICPPDAYFMGAFESIHWKTLKKFMSLYHLYFDGLIRSEACPYELGRESEASNPCLACFTPDYGVPWDTFDCSNGLMFDKYDRESDSKSNRDLRSNLLQAYLCKASDPRDLIYAFLGISDQCYGIYPDYSPHISFQEVCTQLTRNIICHDRSLEMLRCAYQGGEPPQDTDWPSWVLDWRKLQFNHYSLARRYGVPCATSFSFGEDDKGNQNRIIEVRGVLCTKLRHDPVPDDVHELEDRVLSVTSEDMSVQGRGKKGDEVWALDTKRSLYILRRRGQYHQLVGGILDWKPAPEHYFLKFEDYDMPGLEEMEGATQPGLETVRIC